MNIINEREREQSNENNIVVESSASNNDIIYYTFNRNGLLSYYIHSKHRNFLYIIFIKQPVSKILVRAFIICK